MKRPREVRTAHFIAGCALALSGGCKTHAGDPVTTPALSASAMALPSTAAPAKPKPWFAGGFSGQYEAKPATVEVKVGAPRAWSADDGKLASGPGKLSLNVDDNGLVDGTSEGALGAGHAVGQVEDDTLRVQLSPDDANGLRGVLVAKRDGDGFKGSIQASSGDSLRVRQASVDLKKQPN